MKKIINREIYNIDAKNKVLGRLAVRVAGLLMGKGKSEYVPYLDLGDSVIIKNVSEIKITGQKLKQKNYYHYSGYPSGLKTRKMKDVMAKNPSEVFTKAVYNMLPHNRLRRPMMNRLRFQ